MRSQKDSAPDPGCRPACDLFDCVADLPPRQASSPAPPVDLGQPRLQAQASPAFPFCFATFPFRFLPRLLCGECVCSALREKGVFLLQPGDLRVGFAAGENVPEPFAALSVLQPPFADPTSDAVGNRSEGNYFSFGSDKHPSIPVSNSRSEQFEESFRICLEAFEAFDVCSCCLHGYPGSSARRVISARYRRKEERLPQFRFFQLSAVADRESCGSQHDFFLSRSVVEGCENRAPGPGVDFGESLPVFGDCPVADINEKGELFAELLGVARAQRLCDASPESRRVLARTIQTSGALAPGLLGFCFLGGFPPGYGFRK